MVENSTHHHEIKGLNLATHTWRENVEKAVLRLEGSLVRGSGRSKVKWPSWSVQVA